MSAMMGGGRVQFGGRIGFEGYLPGELDVTARGENMRLRYPEGIRSVVDMDLSIRGNYKTPTLGGTIGSRRAYTRRSGIGNGRVRSSSDAKRRIDEAVSVSPR